LVTLGTSRNKTLVTKAKGDYQRLTDEVVALEKAVYDDLMTLKSIVRTAFPGETADSVLESLRLS
jgi:hypothetical protein